MSRVDPRAGVEEAPVLTEGLVKTPAVLSGYGRVGSGPPVLLLPGGGGWRLTFESLAAHLARTHTVYALDPPGQGRTRILDAAFGYDADAVAGAVAAFLDAVGLGEVAVVGHSWGGGFALRLAELYPDRVSRLALLAPAGLDVADVWEFRLLRLPVIGEITLRFAARAAIRHMMRKSFAHPERVPRHLVAEAARLMRDESLRRDMLRVERTVDWVRTERALDLVTCPTLILWGALDRYFPVRLLDRFVERLPAAEAHVVHRAGHSLHDDAPEQVHPLVTTFLTEASTTRRTGRG